MELLDLGLFLFSILCGIRGAFAFLGFFPFNNGDENRAKRKLYVSLISILIGCISFIAWIKIAI